MLSVSRGSPSSRRPTDTISDGRVRIGSDPYYALTLPTSTHIALLDTGVRGTHQLLVGRLGVGLDCAGGDADCAGPLALPGDIANHGTADAAILAAADTTGHYRGVTGAMVDGMRVYSAPDTLDCHAVGKAFQRSR